MRLWHYKLLQYLPRQQLLGQWRECMLIAKNLVEKGTPNHILVNRILDYPCWCFDHYVTLVAIALHRRGYKVKKDTWNEIEFYIDRWKANRTDKVLYPDTFTIFENWHNKLYLDQCYYNLDEKYRCGAVPEEEFVKFRAAYEDALNDYMTYSFGEV